MIDPATVCLFIPPGLKSFKLDLFERIGSKIVAAGGKIIRHDYAAVARLPEKMVPIIGGSPELRETVSQWRVNGRRWIYWDRGYCRRVFATWLPRGENGGMYRWHIGSCQMQIIRDMPGDRWAALKTPLAPWRKDGRHIVVALPTPTYERFHGIAGWTRRTIDALAALTRRRVITRDKETKRPLQADLDGAHCLVAHGSNAAVEAVILGCPVIVDRSSAAALVGLTDLNEIERPVTPAREAWARSLAYSQFSERELVDGTLWRMIT